MLTGVPKSVLAPAATATSAPACAPKTHTHVQSYQQHLPYTVAQLKPTPMPTPTQIPSIIPAATPAAPTPTLTPTLSPQIAHPVAEDRGSSANAILCGHNFIPLHWLHNCHCFSSKARDCPHPKQGTGAASRVVVVMIEVKRFDNQNGDTQAKR